jgi:hypothetical protein
MMLGQVGFDDTKPLGNFLRVLLPRLFGQSGELPRRFAPPLLKKGNLGLVFIPLLQKGWRVSDGVVVFNPPANPSNRVPEYVLIRWAWQYPSLGFKRFKTRLN